MADLTTTYMGLSLKNPIIAGSSGLSDSLEKIKQLEEAGAGAVVLKSIFEDALVQTDDFLDSHGDIVCRNIFGLQPDLAGKQVVDTFCNDDTIRVESFVPTTDSRDTTIFCCQLLNKYICGQKAMLRHSIVIDNLLDFRG